MNIYRRFIKLIVKFIKSIIEYIKSFTKLIIKLIKIARKIIISIDKPFYIALVFTLLTLRFFMGFNTINSLVFIAQLITIFPVFWFYFITIDSTFKEIRKQKNVTGAIPVAAFIYMCVVGLCASSFIANFHFLLQCNLIYLVEDFYEINKCNIMLVSLLSIFIFLAVIFHFLKSIFTINSLDRGSLMGLHYKDIFKSKARCSTIITKFVEFLLRAGILILLMNLQIKIERMDTTNYLDMAFLKWINYGLLSLYLTMLVWLIWIFAFAKIQKLTIPKGWFIWTSIQFVCGVFLGIVVLKYGGISISSNSDLNTSSKTLIFGGVVLSLGIIISILINELPIIKAYIKSFRDKFIEIKIAK